MSTAIKIISVFFIVAVVLGPTSLMAHTNNNGEWPLGVEIVATFDELLSNHQTAIQEFIDNVTRLTAETQEERLALIEGKQDELRDKIDEVNATRQALIADLQNGTITGEEFAAEMRGLATEESLVQINANVTDPLGGYDFNASSTQTKYATVTVTIANPNGTHVVENQRMTLIDGGITSFANLLQYNWAFSTAIPGRYNVTIAVTDNSGNTMQRDLFFQIGQTYRIQIRAIDTKARPLASASIAASVAEYKAFSDPTNSTGWIDRLIGSGTYNFTVTWQGVVVNSTLNFSITTNTTLVLNCSVYDPKFLVLDDVDNPLPEAQVYIKHPNGTTNIVPLRTTENGFVNLTHVPGGDYVFTILWKEVDVLQTIQTVDSDGPYTLKCQVYELTANVVGSNGDPVHGAYVVIYTQAGIVYDFKMTDISGQAILKLPIGTYRIEALYSTAYWLTPVTVSTTEPSVPVTSSSPLTVTLPDFPPSIWMTVGFWLLIVVILIVALGTVYILHKKGILSLI